MLTADYNFNDTVDAADYVMWRDKHGESGTGLAAGGNRSGSIEAGDFDVWRTPFGKAAGSGSGAGAVVPQPAILILLIVGMVAMLSRRRAEVPSTHVSMTRTDIGPLFCHSLSVPETHRVSQNGWNNCGCWDRRQAGAQARLPAAARTLSITTSPAGQRAVDHLNGQVAGNSGSRDSTGEAD